MSTKHYINYKRYECKMGIGEYREKGSFVSQETIDKAAELKLTGGFVTKRKNKCNECHTFKSANGSCLCD
jgi:hypothetical protein